MANTLELIIKATDQASRVIQQVNSGGQNLGRTLADAGKIATDLGKNLTKYVTLPLVALGTLGVKNSMEFGESLNKVSTIADTTVMSLEDIKSGVFDLSKVVSITGSDLNEALYQTISATNDTANALGYLEVGAKTAKGGFTDTSTAIDGLTSVMNAYGQTGVESMQKIADIMVTTQNMGKTTVDELARSLYNVIPTASALGVSFEQVGASMAAMTAQGTPTSVATTQMRQLLVELSKAGSQVSDTFIQTAGVSFQQFISQGNTLSDALGVMEKAAQQNGVQLKDMFSSVEAGNAAMQLTGTGAEKFAQSLVGMEQAGGAVEQAFNKMNKGAKATWDKFLVRFNTFSIQVGDVLAPALVTILDLVSPLLDLFGKLPGPIQTTIVVIGALAAMVGPVLVFTGSVITAMTTLSTTFGIATPSVASFGVALNASIWPITLTVIAIGALIAAGVALYQNWDGVVAGLKVIWQGFADFFIMLWEGLKTGITAIIEGITAPIKFMINGIIDGINFMTNGLNKIKINVPSWVPIMGGSTFGFNIPTIPRFHTGGVYHSGTAGGEGLALLRDGERIVTPEQQARGTYANSQSSNQTIIIQNVLDGTVLGETVLNYMNGRLSVVN